MFLKKNKASSAKEEISSLLQEAKAILHKAGKEDSVKHIEETEKQIRNSTDIYSYTGLII